ncbi:MAG: hypothetical protein ACO1OO_12900 [Flavisolibacter sp.]
METFIKVIDDTPFEFTGSLEGKEEVCRVRSDIHDFKMTVSHDGNWQILQQVPAWIKALEPDLGAAIDEAYG